LRFFSYQELLALQKIAFTMLTVAATQVWLQLGVKSLL